MSPLRGELPSAINMYLSRARSRLFSSRDLTLCIPTLNIVVIGDMNRILLPNGILHLGPRFGVAGAHCMAI